ncbi:MAG: hypothetical protein AUG04_02030 [Deltaproteobacteria bacterium 13_1_20CM_2_69_21]|nr:MAG: hypothetical protein AUH38_03430 [Deltaproteobacteria bacterium 13_1_40CM_68_24]OLD07290.1 MAG: hypothetical protein AUI90_10440 [Deltaproteobacteria bacterium 13_1_40CM_3_69_14]OLD46873.1 MAG: hypothetical protein AUI48_06365 [Chloroflexi bacterium 13_1_40CM_2_68_14]OLE64100.1 MAG: hypothetical protein AUG04_02030 [Deltaproteobacteria bacterium 13_1_20CM_2_69_21]
MPQPSLTPEESRLATFCRLFAVVYFAGALCFAASPELTYRIAALEPTALPPLGPEAAFWNVLAVGMMAAAGTACLVTAARPRERRHAILPVVVANLISSALAAVHLVGAGRSRGLMALLVTDVPILLLTVALYRAAAPGVHSAPARGEPPEAVESPKIQLKVSKS